MERYLPGNQFISTLIEYAKRRGVKFSYSRTPLWYYRPDTRTIYLWKEDLKSQPLGFLITALAHEIGHVVDFDLHPDKARVIACLGVDEVPEEVEINAFLIGYKVIRDLKIPFSVSHYVQWISEPLKKRVLSLLVNPI